MAEAVCFYTFTGIMLMAACSVVANRKPIYSVLSLLVVMCCLAALFVMLGAYFIAALQVLLYAGAVLVLFLFVIMLLNLQPDDAARRRAFTMRRTGTAAGLVFFFLIFRVLSHHRFEPPLSALAPADSTVESVARLLFTQYVLPFELASFIILAAIVGAVTLAGQKPE